VIRRRLKGRPDLTDSARMGSISAKAELTTHAKQTETRKFSPPTSDWRDDKSSRFDAVRRPHMMRPEPGAEALKNKEGPVRRS